MITIIILYFIIGLFASILGSIAGLGGGVIIKPLLDLFGHFDLATIGVLSSATVLSMSTVSILSLKNCKIEINKAVSSTIAAGSIVGGIIGKGIFNYLINILAVTDSLAIFQSAFLVVLMLAIVLLINNTNKMSSYKVKNKIIIFVVGLILGLISAFLGIGGGPLNVVVLTILFSMSFKQAAFNSIFIIFFAQLSSLVLVGISTGFNPYDLSMLMYMIIGGLLGGWIGSNAANRISNKLVKRLFNFAIIAIILLNIYNVIVTL